MIPRALAAAAGGVAYFLGHLGFGLWPLLFVFLVPLWWALDAGPEDEGPSCAAALGGIFGLAAHAGGFTWLWPLVDGFLAGGTAAGVLAWSLHGLWFAAGPALAAVAYRLLRRRGAGPAAAGAAPWVGVEWLQPKLFPVQAGAGLVEAPWLAQAADLGGPLLLSGLLALGNASLYVAVVPALRRPVHWVPGLVSVAAALVYGALAEQRHAVPPSGALRLEVGLVQANLDPRDPPTAAVAHRLHLAESEALLADGPLDLVIWPENAYPAGVGLPLPVDATAIRGEALSRARTPLLFGTSTARWVDREGRRIANSALLADADGRVRSAYHKNVLIPLAEFVPGGSWLPSLARWAPGAQRYRADSQTPPLRLGALRVATPICYEIGFADFVARMVRSGRPHWIATLADDSWFGASREPRAHLALARLRAIEHRLPVVRATGSGLSAFIDRRGRIAARSGLLERARLRGALHVAPDPPLTLYARLGDPPVGAAALGATLLAARRRRPEPPQMPRGEGSPGRQRPPRPRTGAAGWGGRPSHRCLAQRHVLQQLEVVQHLAGAVYHRREGVVAAQDR